MIDKLDISNIDAVIFDLDGLLIDSERVSRDCWDSAAATFGFSIGAIYNELLGKGTKRCDEILLEHFGPQFPIQKLRLLKNTLFEQYLSNRLIPLKPGAIALLTLLKHKGYKTALATGSLKIEAINKLRGHEIESFLDIFAFGDEVLKGKPAPDLFLLAASKLQIDPSRCLVLEDSVSGLQAAKAAKMRAIWVPDLIAPDSEISEAQNIPILTSLEDLIILFEAFERKAII